MRIERRCSFSSLLRFGTFCRVEASTAVRADVMCSINAKGFAFFECGRE
jgi:hypothetical protein